MNLRKALFSSIAVVMVFAGVSTPELVAQGPPPLGGAGIITSMKSFNVGGRIIENFFDNGDGTWNPQPANVSAEAVFTNQTFDTAIVELRVSIYESVIGDFSDKVEVATDFDVVAVGPLELYEFDEISTTHMDTDPAKTYGLQVTLISIDVGGGLVLEDARALPLVWVWEL